MHLTESECQEIERLREVAMQELEAALRAEPPEELTNLAVPPARVALQLLAGLQREVWAPGEAFRDTGREETASC